MKKYISISSFLLGLIFLLSGVVLHAQEDTTSRYNESVIVVSSFDPIIGDAFKINEKPVLVDTIKTTPKFIYNLSPYKANTIYEPLTISPARISGEPLTKLYRNYIKVGMGNYTTPLVDVYLNTTRSKKYALGLNYKHFSSSGKIKDYEKSAFSDNSAKLFGKYFFNKYTLSMDLGYDRNMVHYYGRGFTPEPIITAYASLLEDAKHVFNFYGANASFVSNNTNPKQWEQAYSLGYHFLNTNQKVNENHGKFDGQIAKRFKMLKVTDFEKLNIDVSAQYTNNNFGEFGGVDDNTLVKISPSIQTNYKEYSLSLGFKTAFRNSTGHGADFLFFPTAEAKLTLLPKIFFLYAGLDGDVNRYTYREIGEVNPYINPFVNINYEHEKYKIYGGFQSNFSKFLEIKFDFNTSQIDGMMFFINDTANVFMNKFISVHDKVNKLNVNANVCFFKEDKLSVSANVGYFQYSLNSEANAWHMPSMIYSLSGAYNIADKIYIKLDGLFASGRIAMARDEMGNIVNRSLGTSVDVNIGAEYRYNKMLSGFLMLNNISATRNFYYYGYPTHRFNFILGVTYSFGGDLANYRRK